MPIAFFGPSQTDAFIPALCWILVATLFVTVPIILAPLLRRHRRGRLLVLGCAVVAVVGVLFGAVQAVNGFRVLAGQRTLVQTTMSAHYGVHLTDPQVRSLLEGGKVPLQTGSGTVHLEETTPGEYVPVQTGVGPLTPQ